MEKVTANGHKTLKEEFAQEIEALLRTHIGCETLEAQVYFVDDIILIRVHGALTPAETSLAERHDGLELVERTHRQLLETTRPYIQRLVRELVGRDLLNLHSHLNTETGEQLILVSVDAMLSPGPSNSRRDKQTLTEVADTARR